MIFPFRENIDKFTNLVNLAQTGEMQSAVDKYGPFNVNPYYLEDPEMIKAVGFFMNAVVPELKENYRNGGTGIEISKIGSDYRKKLAENGRDIYPENSVHIADKAGYLIKVEQKSPVEDDSDYIPQIYMPTRNLMEIKDNEVYLGKNILHLSGCLGSLAVGTAAGYLSYRNIEFNNIYTPIAIGSFSTAGYLGLQSKFQKLQAGREAYKYYNS